MHTSCQAMLPGLVRDDIEAHSWRGADHAVVIWGVPFGGLKNKRKRDAGRTEMIDMIRDRRPGEDHPAYSAGATWSKGLRDLPITGAIWWTDPEVKDAHIAFNLQWDGRPARILRTCAVIGSFVLLSRSLMDLRHIQRELRPCHRREQQADSDQNSDDHHGAHRSKRRDEFASVFFSLALLSRAVSAHGAKCCAEEAAPGAGSSCRS